MIDTSIFKAYDVRGIYPDQMDEEIAYRIGRAFPRVISKLEGVPVDKLRLGLGHDMRLSAPTMAEQYARGMQDEGALVLDAGQVATEQLYYLVGSEDLEGGLMCTASHNPPAYTGAKLLRRGALALSGDEGINDVRDIVTGGDPGEPGGDGRRESVDVAQGFREKVESFIDPDTVRPMKVVLDGSNGMGGPMVGPILDDLPLEQIQTFWTPDGHFPGHGPNPLLPENQTFIVEKLLSEGAELGIAWDGDADRCFFFDDTGKFVDGDFLTALLADSILAKEPGALILYDVRASRAVRDTVERAGGRSERNRVGHAFFKTRMRRDGAAFGGEVSGHYYFREFYCADSGTLPALLILEMLSVKDQRMSELLAPYRDNYFISGEINSEVADQDAKMNEIAERYSDGEVDWLDGVSVDYDNWHFNVRPSNTEPLLRLNLESLVSPDDMERRRDEVLELIRS